MHPSSEHDDLQGALRALVDALESHVTTVLTSPAGNRSLALDMPTTTAVTEALRELQWQLGLSGSGTLPIQLPESLVSQDAGTESLRGDIQGLTILGRWTYQLRKDEAAVASTRNAAVLDYVETVIHETGWHPLAADLEGSEPVFGVLATYLTESVSAPEDDEQPFTPPAASADLVIRQRKG